MSSICKFPPSHLYSPLELSCFVMETNTEIMKQSVLLKYHRMLLVMQGEGSFRFNSLRVPFSAGTLLFGFKGEMFSAEKTRDVIYLYVDFGGRRADELFHRFGIHNENRSFNGFDGLIPLWRDSLTRANGDTVDLASESILLYSFSRLSSHKAAKSDNVISKMLEITEERFSDPELSVSMIARELSYNPKYLSHAFRKSVGATYSDYLRNLRIKYAISLFDEGLDSVKNVALLSGFADPLYFSNVFRRTVGLSPREYILNLQGGADTRKA